MCAYVHELARKVTTFFSYTQMFGIFCDGLWIIMLGVWHKICIFNKKVVPLRCIMRECAFMHTNAKPKCPTAMKELEIKTKVTVCSQEELPVELRELVEAAKNKTQDAYCPYSHYHVGAAALLADGQVVTGANQENAAYPSGLCAERTTLFAANANNPTTPVSALAVACYTDGHFTSDPASPCGACRQVMLETEHRFGVPMKVLLYGDRECYVFESAKDLLPVCFTSESLA